MARSARQAAAALLVALALAPLAAPARAAGEPVTLRGTYVQVHGDRRTGGEMLHYLRTGTTWQRLRFDGHRYRYRVRATDCAGNASAWTRGPSQALDVRDQNEPGISYSGAWSLQRVTGAWRGSPRHTSVPGRSVTWRLTGRNVAFVAATGADRGRARNYVDGALARTVDLHAASRGNRRVVYQRRWTGDSTHSLKVVVAAGTPDRPRVDADAFVRLSG